MRNVIESPILLAMRLSSAVSLVVILVVGCDSAAAPFDSPAARVVTLDSWELVCYWGYCGVNGRVQNDGPDCASHIVGRTRAFDAAGAEILSSIPADIETGAPWSILLDGPMGPGDARSYFASAWPRSEIEAPGVSFESRIVRVEPTACE